MCVCVCVCVCVCIYNICCSRPPIYIYIHIYIGPLVPQQRPAPRHYCGHQPAQVSSLHSNIYNI